LNQTQARIEQASAKYNYETQVSLLNYQIGSLHELATERIRRSQLPHQ
jgi:hypothetical protein